MRSNVNVTGRLILIAIVTALALWIDFAPGDEWLGRNVSTRLGLDLQGGAQMILQPRDPNTPAEAMETARGVVEQRVNGLGLSETVVQLAGANNERIIVELPGEKDPESAIALLQGTGKLEFIDPQSNPLQDGVIVCTTESPNPIVTRPIAAGVSSTEGVTTTNGVTGTNGITGTDGVTNTGVTTDTGTATEDVPFECPIVFETIASGEDLDTTAVALTVDQFGFPAVFFSFQGEARDALARFTASNVGRPMSIVLDNRVISSPTINSSLPGEGIITLNSADRQEAENLLAQLKYGALPVPLEVTTVRTITATLGQSSVEASTIAGLLGLLAVALFMVLFYHLPGLIAVIALLIYTAIIFAVYRWMPITLTLPGIAGLILSIGLAVDANVLIFARLKEELRMGRRLSVAVQNGFDHAWPSIRDSNAATFITSTILYWFGNSFGVSIIKGFALTLMLGVAVSLFTAVFATRTLLILSLRWGWARKPFWYGVEPRETADGQSSTL